MKDQERLSEAIEKAFVFGFKLGRDAAMLEHPADGEPFDPFGDMEIGDKELVAQVSVLKDKLAIERRNGELRTNIVDMEDEIADRRKG